MHSAQANLRATFQFWVKKVNSTLPFFANNAKEPMRLFGIGGKDVPTTKLAATLPRTRSPAYSRRSTSTNEAASETNLDLFR